jgi:transcriptional regulator with XRE-family HTH domain
MAARRQLGYELRWLREQAGKSADEVAKALFWSPSKISRYEWARRAPVPGEVDKLLEHYEVTGRRHGYLRQLAQSAREAGWWDAYGGDLFAHEQQFIGLEHAAAGIFIWQANMVPALLQTEAYAREVERSHRHVEPIPPRQASRRVAVTMRRQQLLAREPSPQVTVVLDEGVLRHPAGGAAVMAGQIRRLAELAGEYPAVTVRVLPLTFAQPIFTSSFTILRFGSGTAEDELPDLVAIDNFTSGCLLEDERETYLYQLAFQRLATAALDPAKSQSLIHKLSGVGLGTGPLSRGLTGREETMTNRTEIVVRPAPGG